jgi:hypothetical protein
MEWNRETILRLSSLFLEKYNSMRGEVRTDRANMSALWNKYLKGYDIRVIRNQGHNRKLAQGSQFGAHHVVTNLINVINFHNEDVSDALIIDNPDRIGQYMLVPRGKAELILVLGMM